MLDVSRSRRPTSALYDGHVDTDSDLPDLREMSLQRLRTGDLDGPMAEALRRMLTQLDSGVEPVAGFQSAV